MEKTVSILSLAAASMLLLSWAGASHASAQASPGLLLDVGNDTDYDWAAPDTFTGPETLDLTGNINRYVRGGCWCIGCVLDGGSGNCTVPIVFSAGRAGNFTATNVALRFTRSRTLGEVTYGVAFRRSEGACWTIRHLGGTVANLPVPSEYKGGVCTAPDYTYQPGSGPVITDDAQVDAMYRLLNGTLDPTGSGTINVTYNDNMSFQTEGAIGVQTLWGPLQMRLIVWS